MLENSSAAILYRGCVSVEVHVETTLGLGSCVKSILETIVSQILDSHRHDCQITDFQMPFATLTRRCSEAFRRKVRTCDSAQIREVQYLIRIRTLEIIAKSTTAMANLGVLLGVSNPV